MAAQPPKSLNFNGHRKAGGAIIGFAPLVDIVLLLICFYLFVTKSIQEHDDPSVQLPTMTSQVAEQPMPAEIVINLRADDKLVINNATVETSQLPGLLATERERAMALGKPVNIVVRADRRQRYGRLDDVLDACRRAGFARLILRATETDSQ